MKIKLPTVTIGIPAYNEYQNLKSLLIEILSQKSDKFILKEIIILSDGSTDYTKNLKKQFKTLKLKILRSSKRLGKPYRINQLFKIINTDIVIVFDADIHLSNNLVLQNLVSSSLKKKSSMVSGFALPNQPKSVTEQIAYAGVQIWDRIRLNKKQSDMYRCEGSIRAFSKTLYKKITFPSTSADEAFSYINTKSLGGNFIFNQKAVIYYNLPKSIKDYIAQQRRYSNSQNIQQENFSGIKVNSFYSVRKADKFWSTLENFKINPFYTSIYLIVIFLIKISIFINPEKHSSLWKVLSTTK